MPTPNLFRRLALSLPNAIESSHMNHPDFRVLCPDNKLRIFATLSGEAIARGVVMLTLDQQASFCDELPEVFHPVPGGWGRMGSTHVNLEAVEEDTLLGALSTAHRNAIAKAKRPAASQKTAPAKAARKRVAAKPKIKS